MPRPRSSTMVTGEAFYYSAEQAVWRPKKLVLRDMTLKMFGDVSQEPSTIVLPRSGFRVEWGAAVVPEPEQQRRARNRTTSNPTLYPFTVVGTRGARLPLAAASAQARETWTQRLQDLSAAAAAAAREDDADGENHPRPRRSSARAESLRPAEDGGLASPLVKRTSWGFKRSRYFVLMGSSGALCYLHHTPSATERACLARGDTSVAAAFFDLTGARFSRRGRDFTIESDFITPALMLQARTDDLAKVWVAALTIARDNAAARVAAALAASPRQEFTESALIRDDVTSVIRESRRAEQDRLSHEDALRRREAEDLAQAIAASLALDDEAAASPCAAPSPPPPARRTRTTTTPPPPQQTGGSRESSDDRGLVPSSPMRWPSDDRRGSSFDATEYSDMFSDNGVVSPVGSLTSTRRPVGAARRSIASRARSHATETRRSGTPSPLGDKENSFSAASYSRPAAGDDLFVMKDPAPLGVASPAWSGAPRGGGGGGDDHPLVADDAAAPPTTTTTTTSTTTTRPSFKITVRSNGGRVIEVDLASKAARSTVRDVKDAVASEAAEFDPSRTRLIWQGKQLDDAVVLADVGIVDENAVVFIVLRPTATSL